MYFTRGILTFACLSMVAVCSAQPVGEYRWEVGPPLLSIDKAKLPASSEHPWVAIKDPSIVQHDGRWHLFCTLRKNKKGDGRIRIGHLSFSSWDEAKDATWNVLNLIMGYHGAPQIFFFQPHKKWYLIYQAEDRTRQLKYGPCFSTNGDITKPNGWTLPRPLYVVEEGMNAGLDFWLICDKHKAHLFFTTLNGKMWRAETSITKFPDRGWSKPVVALRADIFEASHTYALKGRDKYLTIVEAQADRRRHFKAFVANSLDGKWTPLPAARKGPSTERAMAARFVSPENVVNQEESWATSYSHGEFIRTGADQRMEIDPDDLRLLFQGANDQQYRESGGYGQIPWKLGILERKKQGLGQN